MVFFRSILVIICVSLQVHLLGQDYIIESELIDKNNGLAHTLTSSIFKDSTGHLWIGTKYGLNKYDGYTFELYTREKNNLYENATINHISQDSDGLIWIYHQISSNKNEDWTVKIDILNPKTKRITPFEHYFKGKIPFKYEDIKNCKINDLKQRIWIVTRQGDIYIYEHQRFRKVLSSKFSVEILTVGLNDNIALSNEKQLGIAHINAPKIKYTTTNQPIDKLRYDKSGYLWIVTLINQPNLVPYQILKTKDGEDLQPFYLKKDNAKINISKWFSEPTITPNGFWLVNLNDGLNLFDKSGKWLSNISSTLNISSQRHSLYICETLNHLWLNSVFGIIKLKIIPQRFEVIRPQSSPFMDSRGIGEAQNGHIYFNVVNSLYEYSPTTKGYKKLHDKNNYAILPFGEQIWTGNPSKMFAAQYNLKTDFSVEYMDTSEQKIYDTYSIIPSSIPHRLLFGTDKGLIYIDTFQQNIIHFKKYNGFEKLKSVPVNFLYANKYGIWVASNEGIYLLNEKEGIIAHWDIHNQGLPYNTIQHIFEDKQGQYWLATSGGGIIRWQPQLNNIPAAIYQQYTTSDGLSDNYTYAIYEDEYDNLWVSSDKGIMKIPKSSFNIQTFTTQEGLPHDEFNFTSHLKASDGSIYFGGLGGITHFHPQSFQDTNYTNTALRVTRYMVLENGKDTLTSKFSELSSSQKIVIHPSDKLFELEFVLMDFEPLETHLYQYKIEGYQNNWANTNQNLIRINSLPYGKYTLKIRGKHINKGWSNQEIILPISVLKPFYLQWWFVLSVIGGVIAFGVLGVRWRILMLKKDRQRLENEVQLRTETISQQAEDLKVLDQTKTRFFSNITHEFRTPLTLILGPLEQIIQEKPAKKQLYPKLENIKNNAKHLLNLINQLLDISKIETGNMNLELSYGNIILHTRQLVAQIQPLAINKLQNLEFVSSIDAWEINYDKDKWTKIIFNLLSNAVKFTPHKGKINVFIQALQNEKPTIQVIVKDSGVGIDDKKLPYIFNRFYQTDDSHTRLQEGTGIGLALVKELIELQNGTIEVESEVGVGTTFILKIPVLKTSNTPKENIYLPISTVIPSISDLPQFSKPTINEEKLQLLLIEDNAELRAYIKSCLDENIYQITEASNGEEGLEMAFKLIPDLIVSDVMMPKKDGFEVAETIRKTLSTSHIPLILLTAKSALESRLEGLKRGADAYLTKPFSPEELVLRIQKLIELRQLLQRQFSNVATQSQSVTTPAEIASFEQESQFIQDFKDYILQHLADEDLNGEKLCKVFLMSRMQLHRKIKALTNLPTGQFVRAIRLEKAKELLQSTSMNVSEVAYQTGFSSPTNFSRSFKKYFGISPSEINL